MEQEAAWATARKVKRQMVQHLLWRTECRVEWQGNSMLPRQAALSWSMDRPMGREQGKQLLGTSCWASPAPWKQGYRCLRTRTAL